MPYVITEACINIKDKACVDVCPVDCIYEGPDQLFIKPDECIDCGACEPECPVTAIFPEEDVPANLKEYIALNKDVFDGPNPPGRPTRSRGRRARAARTHYRCKSSPHRPQISQRSASTKTSQSGEISNAARTSICIGSRARRRTKVAV